jgi:predicted dehydrogenase
MNKNISGGTRIGIIGLDNSRYIAYTSLLNASETDDEWFGYKVVAAYPATGSDDIPASNDQIAVFTEDIKRQGIEIVSSIDELLKKIDVVFLDTADGRKHLKQALPVIKAGKRMFIENPVAASLADAVSIFDQAKQYNTPLFSTSFVRYITGIEEIATEVTGNVLAAVIYGPADYGVTHPDLF